MELFVCYRARAHACVCVCERDSDWQTEKKTERRERVSEWEKYKCFYIRLFIYIVFSNFTL